MGYIRHPNTNCLICSKPIYKRKSQVERNSGHVFCSVICYSKFNIREKPCLVCGNLIRAGLNKKTCGRSCANIHRAGIKYKLNRPRDKAVDQRRIKLKLFALRGEICEQCGYDKREVLHIHHLDRNRQNKKFNNLKLLCPNCHYEEHYLKKSWFNKNLPVSYLKSKLVVNAQVLSSKCIIK